MNKAFLMKKKQKPLAGVPVVGATVVSDTPVPEKNVVLLKDPPRPQQRRPEIGERYIIKNPDGTNGTKINRVRAKTGLTRKEFKKLKKLVKADGKRLAREKKRSPGAIRNFTPPGEKAGE